MAYGSRKGKRPFEHASRASHSQIINDEGVKQLLHRCHLPKPADQASKTTDGVHEVPAGSGAAIGHIVAVDGGYSEVIVRPEYPSATLAFFQFGILAFSVNDLRALDYQEFIFPEDMERLRQLERIQLAIPARTMCLESESSLTHSIRRILHEFMERKVGDFTLNSTMRWLVFRKFVKPGQPWSLSQCPHCAQPNVSLIDSSFDPNEQAACPNCGGPIWPCDLMRLHEAIDDELGAAGVFGYLTNAIEQLLIVHFIRTVLRIKPALLPQILVLKDGPLAYFGQTANLHKPMRELVRTLASTHGINMCGLEKSGAFVEHADEVINNIPLGHFRILTDEYIYKNVVPGKPDPDRPYGATTYYGHKAIFHSATGRAYVVNIPSQQVTGEPQMDNLINPLAVLDIVASLECDMYDNALVPVALANKLVSLANHPSQRILQRFAVDAVPT